MDSSNAEYEEFGREFIFTYPGDLESNWNDKVEHLMLVVVSKHSLSQFSVVTKQKYYNKGEDIIVGDFKQGICFSVI